MKFKSIIFAILLIGLWACKKTEARYPKQHSTTSFYTELIAKNKQLIRLENKKIAAFLAQDNEKKYIISPNGFWYTYEKKDSLQLSEPPKTSDIVTLQIEIKDLNNNIIYPKEEKIYKVDKEDLIPALQDGIKLMRKDETITFVIPSHRAFGITGDGNKIKGNQPIKSIITLINIKNQKNESN